MATDEEEKRRRDMLAQIPGSSPPGWTGGTGERVTGNDFTRNVQNTLAALAPVGGIAAPAVSKLASAGMGLGGAMGGKALAYGVPAAAYGALAASGASNQPTPQVAAPAAARQPSVVPNPSATPIAQMDPTSVSRQDPANPMSAMPDSAAGQPVEGAHGAFRFGRGQYSDSAEGMNIPTGFTGKPNAQNMAAAERLAQRSAQRSGVPMIEAAGLRGQQNLTPQTSGSGYGLLDQGARDRRSALMDAQQVKPGARTALAALLRQQGEQPGLDLARERMTAEQEGQAADRGLRSQELAARMGESAATRELRAQELGDTMQTNAARREASGVETSAARRMQALQDEYLGAKTPEAQQEAARKLQALSGKSTNSKENFMVVGGGQEWDERAGAMRNVPQRLIDLRTGQLVGGGQQAPQGPAAPKTPEEFQALPPGTVFIGPDGKQYRKD